MKPLKITGMLIIVFLVGCTAVPVGNKGVETGSIGLHNEIPITTSTGRDWTARLIESSGGGVGLTIVGGIAVTGLVLVGMRLAKPL